MRLTWYSAGTEEPRDEQADLMAGYWASIGPNEEGRFDWTILRDGKDVTGSRAHTADAAKAAVEQWFEQGIDYSAGRTTVPPDGL